jgi:thioredoxin reductase
MKVIVIGAGPAGLAAGTTYQRKRANKECVLLSIVIHL